MERRLAAIMAADVVGYSRLIRADEEGTITALRALRADLVDPKIAEHNGRIVKLMGDGMLAEFASVVDAVRAAVETQASIAERNAGLPEERRITFRVGVNLGDIVIDGDDIQGDGVNVAARLEGLAEPGGICLSASAHEQVRDKLDIAFDDMGEVEVKNIARPVRVFRVLGEGETAAPAARARPRARIIAAAAALVIALAAGGTWWWQAQPDFEPADPTKMAYALPEKPSIAVLPFDNLSGDPAQDYLGDGLTENIIAVLSTSPDLFVIARNSAFTFKGKATKVQQVAEELGVRYVLEGSVQLSGNRLRVTAQLIDAIDGRHMWAERYDRELMDLFALQDDITQRILEAMHVNLTLGEQARVLRNSTGDPDIYRLIVQGRAHWLKATPEGHEAAERLWTEAYERNPDSHDANRVMGWLHWQKVFRRFSKDPRKDMALARSFAEKALSLGDPGHALLATLDMFARKFESAIAHADRTVEMLPTAGDSLATAGWVKLSSGQPQEGIALLKRAIRLEPYHPSWMMEQLAVGYMILGQYEDARVILESLLASRGEYLVNRALVYSLLAAIAVLDGDMDLARKNIEKMIEVNPAANVSSLKRVLYFLKDQAFLNRYLDALRKAGLPEKPPLKLPDKPSIAVLPFDNLSNDPEQKYFADGMAEDIITDLSKISGLFVIARNSSFSYKGKQTEVRTIARELGVKYILEGSVRRAGDQVRINAQLIDATTGGHLWAERYDGSATDVFAVQDRITEAIVQSLKVTLTGAEQGRLGKKPTDDPLAYDLYLRARAAYVRFDEDGLHEALRLFKEAHEQDPTFADAYARRAQAAYVIFNLGFASSELREIAESLSARALELDSGNGLAMAVQAQFAQWAEDGHDRAIELARSAVHIDPGNAEVRMILAIGYAHADRFEEARREISLAIRLAPAPDAYLSFLLGWGLLLAGDYAKAVGFLEKARDGIPNSPWNRGGLAAAYAGAGNRVDAISELDVYLRFEGLAGRSVRGFEAAFRHWAPKVRNNLLDAFRKAGLPEWPHGFDGKEEDRLVEQDIRDLVFGQTRIGSTSAGGEYEVDIGLDGMAEWRQGGGAFSAEYWLEGDALCYKFRGLFSGRAMCGSVFRNPGGKYDSKDQYVFVDPLDLAYFSIKR